MVARDDSVIRGSLIACLIFLVLSLCLNFFLWRHGDTVAAQEQNMASRLQTVQAEVATLTDRASRMKAMLGVGSFTQAQIDQMKENASDDPDMQTIEEQYAQDMSYFGPEKEASERSYPALPQYLAKAIRQRNGEVTSSRAEETKIRAKATTDVANAQTQQKIAESARDDANKQVVKLSDQFQEDRDRMIQEKEDTKDKLVKNVKEYNSFRQEAVAETNKLTQKANQLQGTIDTQKFQLNELRSDQFETTQGEVRYVARGGNITTINLGSADALRPGITFGVIDADETRLKDAKVKATIQVTQIQGPHLAQARVVAFPEIRNPLIPGDKIFSPFWAPGRVIKIALAGDIDLDGDGRPDNEALKGQIRAAGATVAAEVTAAGGVSGKLDSTIRFMVVGDDPQLSRRPNEADDNTVATIEAMGRIRAKASELGLTVIPAWKLQSYLKTLNDTLTTPLGSATRGEDFPPEPWVSGSRLPNTGAEIYNTPSKRMQQGNKILAP
ncbi:hypothetical protein N9018_02815 [Rhodopirellula sp.]|nr:hypothetical protein [Rhodopirellula sp.]MDB4477116.1 hypothetical protein [Rhodopirellula sp.]